MKLEGKVAVVTGAAKGIGNAVTRALLEQGVTVAALSRTLESLQQGLTGLPRSENLRLIAADMTQEGELIAAASEVEQTYGHVEILVNCAGISQTRSYSMAEVESETFHWMMDTNAAGMMVLTRELYRLMKRQDEGYIINILSTAAYQTGGGGGLYAASKYAARALTESLAAECKGTGVRVSSISPGPVRTNIWSHKETPVSEARKEKMLRPEDIAQIALFLLQLDSNAAIGNVQVEPWFYQK